MNTENPEKDAFLSDSPGRQTDFQAGMNLTGVGRDIDEQEVSELRSLPTGHAMT